MLEKLWDRITRRYWVRRIDRVLAGAREAGHLDSWLWHELDGRLKYEPKRRWGSRPRKS